MKKISGDIITQALNHKFDIIVHGCNCMCTMGAGVAKLIKKYFPEAYQADLKTKRGDIEKLGSYSKAESKGITIINAYTQYYYGNANNIPPVNYEAIKTVFKKLNIDFKGETVGIPKIGSGLAGGNWNTIRDIIEHAAPDLNIIVVEYYGN
jgi:O-acetyl-ADP-ribose deacetylase (regulator of RNase III)